MTCLAGMNPLRRRAGRRHGRSDLAGDMAAFAHAGDDHAAGHLGQDVERLCEGAVQAARQIEQGFRLCLQHARRDRHIRVASLPGSVGR